MVCGGHRQKTADYVLENWGAARKRLWKRNGVLACSAEGHVYHALSSRMSSLAMGWSRHGASQMAVLSSPSTSMRIFNRHGQGINLWENRVVFSRFFCYTLFIQRQHFGKKLKVYAEII